MVTRFLLLGFGTTIHLSTFSSLSAERYDVVVYGGTSAGVIAAIQARRMDRTVVLIEPGKHLGGLTSGGLGATDIGNKGAIGGLAREFYRRVSQHYAHPSAWRQQRRAAYRSSRQQPGDDSMWTFEPHVAERIFRDMAAAAGVVVVYDQPLKRPGGAVLNPHRQIERLLTEQGQSFAGRCFVDATYEGDLLAEAGVTFHVGRESNSTYGETLNGVQTEQAIKHQMMPGVDPYVEAGQPQSGLLPGLHPEPPGEDGTGDHRVQAYCLRMCLTDDPANRIPFSRPDAYEPQTYELLLRNFEAGADILPWHSIAMPNRKTDTNNNGGFSTDYINYSYTWAEADYETRRRIFHQHLVYQQGLTWTLANHPRVPDPIRREARRWGLCKDEFPENGGWPHQLYVREARRMIADYVMTQHNCEGQRVAPDPVGLAAYTMDSHNVQRYVDALGHVRNEGDVQVGGFPPYPISYRSIVPQRQECVNLVVPVCLSASHIAYGSIRMEPVFMVLGQSAATAVCLAIEREITLHELDFETLRERLLRDGQVLAWPE